MRILLAVLVGLLASPSFAHANEEQARQATHVFKEQYWQCLANETQRILPRNLSVQDFSFFIKGVCSLEAQKFRVALVDYLALKFPSIEAGTHISSANEAISLAQADIVSAYVEMRSNTAR